MRRAFLYLDEASVLLSRELGLTRRQRMYNDFQDPRGEIVSYAGTISESYLSAPLRGVELVPG